MDDFSLPKEVDVVIVGTGLIESILSAACCRVGKSVLHLDKRSSYGFPWSSMNYENFLKLQDVDSPYISDVFLDVKKTGFTHQESHRFSIDLMPRIQLARGAMTSLLISSDVARYSEYKMVKQMGAKLDSGEIKSLPTSKGDFILSSLPNMQKRLLTKFFTTALHYEDNQKDYADFASEPISKYFVHLNISDEVQEMIYKCVLMVPPESMTTLQGFAVAQRFLQSCGVYDAAPLMYPLYGVSELPQGFCRLSAVFGGIFILDSNPKVEKDCVSFKFNEEQHSVKAKVGYVVSADFLENPKVSPMLFRGVCVTDKPVTSTKPEDLAWLNLGAGVFMLQLPSGSRCVPQNKFMIHLTCLAEESTTAEKKLAPVMKEILPEDVNIDLTAFFTVNSVREENAENSLFIPVNATEVGKCPIDYVQPLETARAIFEKLYPGEEYLPTPPNPEDIILDYGDRATTAADQSAFVGQQPDGSD